MADTSPISTAIRMQPGMRRTANLDVESQGTTPISLSNFLNTPVRTRQQHKNDSMAGSALPSPF